MIDFFVNQNYIVQALIATLFTWFVTALGASLVFLFKKINQDVMDIMLSLAGGIMISATFFSLLKPAIELSNTLNLTTWKVVSISFFLGGLCILIGNKIFDKISDTKNLEKQSLKRIFTLILSITLHNIPEGFVVGVSYGAIAHNLEGANLINALMISLGIGIQNFPEGISISLPLRREKISRFKAFFYGQLSGFVEPIAGVIGAFLAIKVRIMLPYLLSFAGGAMIYAVVVSIIPESFKNEKKNLMALFTIIGFTIMMILDVYFG